MYKAVFSTVQTLWDKWNETDAPTTNVADLGKTSNLAEDEGLQLQFDDKHFVVMIDKITQDEVLLSTNKLFVQGVSQGSITQPHPVQIPMRVGETRTFLTPTINAGGKWDIKLEAITLSPSEVEQSSKQTIQQESQQLPTTMPSLSTPPKSENLHPPQTHQSKQPPPKRQLKLPKPYFKEIQGLLKEVEEKIQSKVLVYYVPTRENIKPEDPDYFLEQLQHIGHQEKLTLIIYSVGGDSLASLRIATLLRKFCKTLEVIIPSVCASAATNLALSADVISMSPIGFLTAIDTQFTHPLGPANKKDDIPPISYITIQNIIASLELEKNQQQNNDYEDTYRTLYKYIHPVVVGDMMRSSKRSEIVATKMMKMHADSFENEDKITNIAKHLVNGYPEHGWTILFEEAKEIGLPVREINDDLTYILWDLLKYYKTMTKVYITNLGKGYNHHYSIPIILESVNKRVFYKNSYQKRYSVETSSWNIENDNSYWVKLTPSSNDTGFKLDPIEIDEVKLELHETDSVK